MFRRTKEEGYEVVAITLAALLIFSTLFLTENRATRERSVPLIPKDSESITQTTNTLPEGLDVPSDISKEVQSRVPESTIAGIATTTTRSYDSTTISGTTLSAELEDFNSEKVLDDLQIDACEAADESGACQKLFGLSIVEIEDCCKYLGRCCA